MKHETRERWNEILAWIGLILLSPLVIMLYLIDWMLPDDQELALESLEEGPEILVTTK